MAALEWPSDLSEGRKIIENACLGLVGIQTEHRSTQRCLELNPAHYGVTLKSLPPPTVPQGQLHSSCETAEFPQRNV